MYDYFFNLELQQSFYIAVKYFIVKTRVDRRY